MKTKSKNKILSGLLVASLAVSAVFVNSTDVMAAGIMIDATNFPNETFRTFVEQYDLDNSNALETSEIDAVTDMAIDSTTVGANITSIDDLTGIGHFTSLETLETSYTYITTLDLSGNTALTSAEISGIRLNSINTTGLTALITLSVNARALSSIDVTDSTELKTLSITGGSLQSLDVSQNSELITLSIDTQYRADGETVISILDVSNNTKLDTLAVQFTDITTLDLTNNTALTYLNAPQNLLTSINVTGAPLTTLDVNGNYLPNKAAVIGFTGTWGEGSFRYGTQKAVQDNNIVVEINDTNFPDPTFRAWVKYAFDNDGIDGLSAAELANATEVVVAGNEIITTMEFFRGIELLTSLDTITMSSFSPDAGMNEYDFTVFPALKDRVKVIEITNSNIAKLNVSGMTALETLNLEASSRIVELNINDCTGLKELDASGTKLTTLNTSTNTSLEKLTLNNTALLHAIDLSKNTALKTLLMNNTGLKTLDVSGLSSLTALSLSDAAITYLDVSNTGLSGIFTMPEAVTYFDMSNTDITSQPNRRSVLLETFIAKNSQLEYLSINHATKLKNLDVSGSKYLTYIDLTNTNPEYINVSGCSIPTKELVEGFDTTKWDEKNFIFAENTQIPSPYVKEGANLVAKPGEALTLTSTDDFAYYDRVEINGVVVDNGLDISTAGVSVKASSIAVTLNAEYLGTLTPNEEYVVAIYSEMGRARAVITVSDSTAPDPTNPEDPTTDVPKTGDTSNNILFVILATISVAAASILTIVMRRRSANQSK